MSTAKTRPRVPETGEKITVFHVRGKRVEVDRVVTVEDRSRLSMSGDEFGAGGNRLNVNNLYPNKPTHRAPLGMTPGGFIYAREGDEQAAAHLLRNSYAEAMQERAREALDILRDALEPVEVES